MPVSVEGRPAFWRRVASSPRRLLALDYDGTLAPFRVARMEAKPLAGMMPQLARIAACGSAELVVVSGRALDELEPLLSEAPPLWMIGSHGFETRGPRGERQLRSLSLARVKALDAAEAILHARCEPKEAVERKPASVALHTRGREVVDAERVVREVHEAWRRLEGESLEVRPFDGGVELRARGVDKGLAFEAFLSERGSYDLVVYIGDDQTDEDAFEVVEARGGIGIKVGEPRSGATSASGKVADCAAVLALLKAWP